MIPMKGQQSDVCGASRSAVKGGATKLEFRPLAFVRANGKLYMSAASVILQRVDGHNPAIRTLNMCASLDFM